MVLELGLSAGVWVGRLSMIIVRRVIHFELRSCPIAGQSLPGLFLTSRYFSTRLNAILDVAGWPLLSE